MSYLLNGHPSFLEKVFKFLLLRMCVQQDSLGKKLKKKKNVLGRVFHIQAGILKIKPYHPNHCHIGVIQDWVESDRSSAHIDSLFAEHRMFKNKINMGRPVALWQPLILAQVMISRFHEFEPCAGLCAHGAESAWDSLSPSLPRLSLFLKINKL